MSNWLETITGLINDSLKPVDEEPRLPSVLRGLDAQLADLLNFSSELDGGGIERWLAKLQALINNQEIRHSLLARALQMRFPRLAEILTFVGVIDLVFEPNGTDVKSLSLDFARLKHMIADPGGYLQDASPAGGLGWLLSKVQNLKDAKAVQVLALMIFSSPQELVKFEYTHKGFTALPLKDLPPGISLDDLEDLINKINSPLRLPMPAALPVSLNDLKAQLGGAAVLADYFALTGPEADPLDGLSGLGLELQLNNPAAQPAYDLGRGWSLGFRGGSANPGTFRLSLKARELDPAVLSDGELELFFSKQVAPNENLFEIGAPDQTHFSVHSAEYGLRFHAVAKEPLFDIQARFQRISFALKPDFLGYIRFGLPLPDLVRFESDLSVRYIQGKGISGQGSLDGLPGLGIQFAYPLNLKIGTSDAGLSVDQVVVRLEVALDDQVRLRLLMRYSASARLGPLSAQMDGAGTWVGHWTKGQTAGLEPPTGIGLALNAGPIVGGGFLQVVPGGNTEFAGALQIKILEIGAFAFGLYKTLPSGDPSFVAIIGIRFPPPGIQVSFGFAISGFGGLVGVNRRADTDKLRERLTSGSAGDVLFCEDPMKNAPRLLGDMQEFFPDEKGIFIVGPTLQINWLELLKLDVGVFIELPGPRKIFIAGSARLVIGASEQLALVYLRIDFIGGVDLTKSLIFFDAALVRSHVMGIFDITGGVGLRVAYGSNGYFVFTAGGFHPSFNPGGMDVPRLARVGASMSPNLQIADVWFKLEMYLAVTPNTFQLGAHVEAGMQIGPISAHGWFIFDALIQFRPFHFVAHLDAGFDVEVEGVSLYGVRVEGTLTGPGPLVVNARASVKLLFVRISGNVTFRLGSDSSDALPPITNLIEHLKLELSLPQNLRSEGEDRSVILHPRPAKTGALLIAPVGQLIWEQKRVPLKLPIQKFEGVDLDDWHELSVTCAEISPTQEMDWFSVGTYLKRSDAEALNSPRFEQQQSGLRLGAGEMTQGDSDKITNKFKLVKLPHHIWLATLLTAAPYINAALASVMHDNTHGAQVQAGEAVVKVQRESWDVHQPGAKITQLNSAQAFTEVKRSGGAALPANEAALDLRGVI